MTTLEHIERLHRRIHMFVPNQGDKVIRVIHELSKATGKPYLDLLEEAVKQVIENELPRYEGTGDRPVKGKRKAKHPTRLRIIRLQKPAQRNARAIK